MSRVTVKHVTTAADILEANKGVGPGFDALRLVLSVWIFTLHSMFVCIGLPAAAEFAANPIHRIFITPILPMFFGVSGYLVTGSAIRTKNVSTFLLFRVFRIAPALIVEVTLSAIVLGPWLTETTLIEYFSDPTFFRYFLNIVGSVHFYLPGLFTHNPVPGIVNNNLWTLRPEFFCYIFITIMIVSKVIFSRRYFAVVGLSIFCLTVAYMLLKRSQFYSELAVADWKILILAFILGCAALHWNDRIVISTRNAVIAAFGASVTLVYPPFISLGLLGLTYLVVYIGTRKLYLPSFLRSGDYSYGVYLFGFPLQQTLVYFLPLEYRHEAIVLGLGLPLTLAFAMFSWHFVEKPILKLKAKFKPSLSAVSEPAPHIAA
jgi:peptidoglycan/LPS O-acetylase OafA/YrhL